MKLLLRGLVAGSALLASFVAYSKDNPARDSPAFPAGDAAYARSSIADSGIIEIAAKRKTVSPGVSYAEYLYQIGVDALNRKQPNVARGVKLLNQSADAGFPAAMLFLADLYARGEKVAADEAQAERLLVHAAAAGSVKDADKALGALYSRPGSPIQNDAKAIAAYQAAADLGDTDSMVALAGLIIAAKGTPFDFDRAKDLLDKAVAGGGEKTAWRVYGDLYRSASAQRDDGKAADAYQKAIEFGDSGATLVLATMLGKGEGVPADFDRARSLLEKATQGPDAEGAWRALGDLYRNGDATHRDPAKAVNAYQHAADLGDKQIVFILADMLGKGGDGAATNFSRAVKLLQSVVQSQPADGWNALGDLYRTGELIHQDPAKAVDAYQHAIAAGSVQSMLSLAEMLGRGEGVKADFAQAVSLAQEAIAADDKQPWGWSTLGDLYRNADPPNRDMGKAVDAYQNAAARGNGWANVSLGQILASGDGVAANPTRAAEYFQKGVAAGTDVGFWAWKLLGDLYRTAPPPESSPAKAIDAYRHAIALGNIDANLPLAGMLARGEGIAADFGQAESMLKAAIQGGDDKEGWAALGDLYRTADASHRDMAKAIDAYRTAVKLGNPSASIELARVLASGEGVPADFNTAQSLLRTAIAGGEAESGWSALGTLLRDAALPNRDLPGAAAAFQHAADLGDPWAMVSLADMAAKGNGIAIDFDRALDLYNKSIGVGGDSLAFAWSGLGDLYQNADVAHRDFAKAAAAYRHAVDLGNRWAMVTLARMLATGRDHVPADLTGATALLQKAIAAGDDVARDAWGVLGDIYRAPGSDRDPAKAVAAYQKAIGLGNSTAMLTLASLYAHGDGVTADFNQAAKLIEDAIKTGEARDGWAALGDLYRDADKVHADVVKMVDAYQHAADAGNVEAMVTLGKAYVAGQAVSVDYEKAQALFEKAVASGNHSEAGMLLGDLYLARPAAAGGPQKALDAYRTSAAAGNGAADLAAAQIESTRFSETNELGAMIDHYQAAARILGPDAVVKQMLNLPSDALYASVQELLTRAGKYQGRADGTFRRQMQTAIGAFCAEKQVQQCETDFVNAELLNALLKVD